MLQSRFQNVEFWVFDLDNTLYPPSAALFDQIDHNMTQYIMRKFGHSRSIADQMRKDHWANFGTTLAGLMHHHGIDPHEFLADAHDICHAKLTPNPDLAMAISRLDGRKIIHTNGSQRHAQNVLEACGLSDCFDAIFGVDDLAMQSKPHQKAYDVFCDRAKVNPKRAAIFEDSVENLKVPFHMGMETILLTDGQSCDMPHVNFQTDDLTGFIAQINNAARSEANPNDAAQL